eukprot:SM000075S22003  [mRNA]  locus=s75:609912:613167:- [translate_table: standard]
MKVYWPTEKETRESCSLVPDKDHDCDYDYYYEYDEGRCRAGIACRFSHDAEPLTKAEACKFHILQSCMKGGDCPFSHDLARFPCKYLYAAGSCLDGAACRFSHAAAPLPPEALEALATRLEQDRQALRTRCDDARRRAKTEAATEAMAALDDGAGYDPGAGFELSQLSPGLPQQLDLLGDAGRIPATVAVACDNPMAAAVALPPERSLLSALSTDSEMPWAPMREDGAALAVCHEATVGATVTGPARLAGEPASGGGCSDGGSRATLAAVDVQHLPGVPLGECQADILLSSLHSSLSNGSGALTERPPRRALLNCLASPRLVNAASASADSTQPSVADLLRQALSFKMLSPEGRKQIATHLCHENPEAS